MGPGAVERQTVLEAHLAIRHRGCVVSECLTDGAQAAQVSADRDADVLVMHAPRAEQVDTFVKHVVATQAKPPEIVLRTPTSVIVRGRNPEWGVVATIHRSGCGILWPSVWRDGIERYTVLASDRARLDALVRELARIGDVRVERVSQVDGTQLAVSVPLADLTEPLTARQLQAITLAIGQGYYETPRRTSSQALAESLGLSRSTFEEHLRKAEQRVLERVAGAILAHPALVAGARGRVGRPRAAKRVDA